MSCICLGFSGVFLARPSAPLLKSQLVGPLSYSVLVSQGHWLTGTHLSSLGPEKTLCLIQACLSFGSGWAPPGSVTPHHSPWQPQAGLSLSAQLPSAPSVGVREDFWVPSIARGGLGRLGAPSMALPYADPPSTISNNHCRHPCVRPALLSGEMLFPLGSCRKKTKPTVMGFYPNDLFVHIVPQGLGLGQERRHTAPPLPSSLLPSWKYQLSPSSGVAGWARPLSTLCTQHFAYDL